MDKEIKIGDKVKFVQFNNNELWSFYGEVTNIETYTDNNSSTYLYSVKDDKGETYLLPENFVFAL